MAGKVRVLAPPRPAVLRAGSRRARCKSAQHSNAVLQIPLIALLSVVLSPAAMAQADRSQREADAPGLVIEAALGWDGTVDRSAPVPVSFLITNHSDRIIEGQFTLSDPDTGHQAMLGEVVIGPGATRRFASIQDLSDWSECTAALRNGGQVLWQRDLALVSGSAFLANVSFALYVDDSGWRLPLPGAMANAAPISDSDLLVAGEQGRPVRCLTVKSWQVPDHPGPLVPTQAIIFPEGAEVDNLNRVQWQAVAEWMCLGGTVFVHAESREIIARLTESAPLDPGAADQSDEFLVRRCGLGAIYEYQQPLFTTDGDEVRRQIAETTALLTKNHLSNLVATTNLHRRGPNRADRNRVLVVILFAFYTLLSGVVALLLFRLTRRRIGAYTLIVVAGGSVASALLGGFLRFSQGDLQWITVTQAGAGGIVQVARIDVQSSGGRSSQVAVHGEHADLQYFGQAEPYYYWNRRWTGFPAFTWQPNRADGDDETYQVRVPMTPWGRRQLLAIGFKRELQPLDFQLTFEPREPPPAGEAAQNDADREPTNNQETQVETPAISIGVFTLKLVNRLPYDLNACWLIVGATHNFPQPPGSQQPVQLQSFPYRTRSQQATVLTTGGPADVYHMTQLPSIRAGDTYEAEIEADFQLMPNDWDLRRTWPAGSLIPSRLTRLGTATAWLIAHIDQSPILSIDTPHTDFLPQDECHFFVQQIDPEHMPDASLFFGEADHAADDPGGP